MSHPENVAGTQMVPQGLAEGEIMMPPPSDSFDAIVRSNGVMPNREVRATYDLTTQAGKVTQGRHMASQIDRGIKDAMVNTEFQLVAATSWPVRKRQEETGEYVSLIYTVLETSEGKIIPSTSAYLYQSVVDIVNMRGGISADRPARVKIVKAGRADKLVDVDLLSGTGPFAPQLVPAKGGKAKS